MSDTGTRSVRLKAANYGCLKKVETSFGPLHALIGPNDSGKSTILRAIRTLCQLGSQSFANVSRQSMDPFHVGTDFVEEFSLKLDWDDGYGYELGSVKKLFTVFEKCFFQDKGTIADSPRSIGDNGLLFGNNAAHFMELRGRLTARFVRFDPDALRKETGLISRNNKILLADERGFGLASVYDAVLKRNRHAYAAIEEDVQTFFPTVKSLNLVNVSQNTTALMLDLVTGEEIDARFASEGLLFYLAFSAIPHLEPTAILLVEEPENGLHPAMMKNVVSILRRISEHTQVIFSTHSPLIINELEPHEVSVVVRDREEGTRVTPISETPNFDERSRVYSLGELWVSYADGNLEGPLFAKEVEPDDPGEPVEWVENPNEAPE